MIVIFHVFNGSENTNFLFLRIKLLGKIGSTLVDPQQKKKKMKERKKEKQCLLLFGMSLPECALQEMRTLRTRRQRR